MVTTAPARGEMMTSSFFQHRWVLFAIRIIVGAVFVYAGSLKFTHPLSFADSIASFRLLPAELIPIVALSLPPLEITLGVLLIMGWQRRVASFGALILCTIFLI